MKKEIVTDQMLRAAFTAMWGDHWKEEDIIDYGDQYKLAIAAAIKVKSKTGARSQSKKQYWANKTDDEKKAHIKMMQKAKNKKEVI